MTELVLMSSSEVEEETNSSSLPDPAEEAPEVEGEVDEPEVVWPFVDDGGGGGSWRIRRIWSRLFCIELCTDRKANTMTEKSSLFFSSSALTS